MAGFRLRKFITNSKELWRLIYQIESQCEDGEVGQLVSEPASRNGGVEYATHMEGDLSHAKSSLGVKGDGEQGTHKVLGVQWDVTHDNFLFDVGVMTDAIKNSGPTKKSVISATAKFSLHLESFPQKPSSPRCSLSSSVSQE